MQDSRHLHLVEFFRGDHSLHRLSFVELRVDHRQRVDIVQRGVAVLDLERLVDLHDLNVRVILAAFLIDQRRRRRCWSGWCVLDVDDHVRELAG